MNLEELNTLKEDNLAKAQEWYDEKTEKINTEYDNIVSTIETKFGSEDEDIKNIKLDEAEAKKDKKLAKLDEKYESKKTVIEEDINARIDAFNKLKQEELEAIEQQLADEEKEKASLSDQNKF